MLAKENMFSDVQEAARSVLIFGVGIFGRLFYCTENFVAWKIARTSFAIKYSVSLSDQYPCF